MPLAARRGGGGAGGHTVIDRLAWALTERAARRPERASIVSEDCGCASGRDAALTGGVEGGGAVRRELGVVVNDSVRSSFLLLCFALPANAKNVIGCCSAVAGMPLLMLEIGNSTSRVT